MPPLDVRKIFLKSKGAEPDTGATGTATYAVVALIDEGNALEEQGRTDEAMARYEAAVRADSRCARAHLNRGNVLLSGGRIDEARSAYEQAIACDPRYAGAHFNLGNLNCRSGAYAQGLQNYQAAAAIKPDFADAFVAMGNALDRLGRAAEAIASYQRALAINPANAGVHFNLGLTAAAQERVELAIGSLRKAVELRPDYLEAHHTLGRVLAEVGRFDAALASLSRAASLAPESAAIARERALVLVTLGRGREALHEAARNLERAPTWEDKAVFAHCAARAPLSIDDVGLRAAVRAAITEPWGIPYQLCWPALSMIMFDPAIAACVGRANEAWPARVPKASLFDAAGLRALAADRLLHAVMQTTPVSTLQFERFLTGARHALLETATSRQPPSAAESAAQPFYAALARQCFLNEYVFDCGDDELAAATACRTELLALLNAKAAVPPLLLLAVAAYFPLCTLPDPTRLVADGHQDPVVEVLRQQISEPLEEQALRAGIRCLTSITHGVSQDVRDQYEEHPYPRWVKLPIHKPTLRFNRELRRVLPSARFTPLQDDSQPEVLIAGCGTGSQPLLMAQRCAMRVLAVDLSLSSIGYALRKTREFGITNIEYAQADILKLGDLSRTFDIVAAVGVLHHLADPLAGWRTLLSRVRPGGFMHLGFYSQIARRHVVKIREFIAARGYGSTADEMRRFRREFAAGAPSAALEWVIRSPDFYSTSECRDLLFHVQEHRLTLDQISAFVGENGLQFLGFELDSRVLHQYRARFADDLPGTNLHNWARFEADNPDTFAGMYQFWVQKPVIDPQ